jgi:hypothetical protein
MVSSILGDDSDVRAAARATAQEESNGDGAGTAGVDGPVRAQVQVRIRPGTSRA